MGQRDADLLTALAYALVQRTAGRFGIDQERMESSLVERLRTEAPSVHAKAEQMRLLDCEARRAPKRRRR